MVRTYAALQVAEVWRYEGETEQVVIERLGEDGSYHAVEASTILPVRAEEVTAMDHRGKFERSVSLGAPLTCMGSS